MSDTAVLREADFMSAISILASKYDCTLLKIDFDTREIDLDGEESDVRKCVSEVEKIFSNYI